MALTDVIEKDLLQVFDEDGDVEGVLHRYAGSKGPLYAALARATARAREDLGELQGQLSAARHEAKATAERASLAEKRARAGEKRAAEADRNLKKTQAALHRSEEIRAKAASLEAHGLGAEALTRLGDVLAEAAKASGAAPAAVAAGLLEAADAHRDVALAAQAARAAEAELRERERRAKVRTDAVDLAEWLAGEKISQGAVLAWRAIGEALHVPSDALGEAVAEALRQIGPLAKARAKGEQDLAALSGEQARLEAETEALRAEQEKIRAALSTIGRDGTRRVTAAEDRAKAAIAATRDEAIRSVRGVEAALTAAIGEADSRVASVVERYRTLAEESGRLAREVAFARALVGQDIEPWREVRPDAWATLVTHLGRWLEALGADLPAPRVDALPTDVANRLRFASLYGAPRLSDVALWLRRGLNEIDLARSASRPG